ncbi:hypothetical protein BV25DRAFT_1307560 [Artomyces pyxidatus]|uniref:Uncharacterized protein n=1 Tax=Artomyces pyxidatus TaxID=48021 RepID=A0ACB8SQI2_9AGAM|nr:hypothetical protein BV25DRAFT_1307560 [Artomyces pyxidatus]
MLTKICRAWPTFPSNHERPPSCSATYACASSQTASFQDARMRALFSGSPPNAKPKAAIRPLLREMILHKRSPPSPPSRSARLSLPSRCSLRSALWKPARRPSRASLTPSTPRSALSPSNSVHSGAAAAPIVSDISSAVQNAITQLNAPGLTIGQGDALTSLTNVLSTILTPAGQASSAPDVSSDFVPAFLPLGSVLGALVGLVLKLVGSLLIVVDVKASLLGLVGVLAPIIVHLNLTPLLVVLGILL